MKKRKPWWHELFVELASGIAELVLASWVVVPVFIALLVALARFGGISLPRIKAEVSNDEDG